jgi:acetyl/propionyl-CoA carboxylase alpha subunit
VKKGKKGYALFLKNANLNGRNVAIKIHKVLIANRGEIAVRIARTARKLNIPTVGVYTPQDKNSLFVRTVDQALSLPAGDLAQNYLNPDLLVRCALETEADGIHPGYGFLAENPDFAAKVEAAGLIWIGPNELAMREIGDKMRAKEIATRAKVPVAPWKHVDENPGKREIKAILKEIGLPALVKATRGGGGRGQRIVRDASEFEEALRSARSEALRSFASGDLFVERFIENPRHIEVQIIADQHGHVFALGERDCTVQRRNQKLIEETPASVLDPETRKRLHNAAQNLATTAGYTNAGTVEFLFKQTNGVWEFFFMEMNARLQVEHPVTEEVFGLDLVELQFRVASRESIESLIAQKQPSGHSIELRLNAEDPANQFLPAPGPITTLEFPKNIRVDTGFEAGDTIPQEYDSLFSKIIVHADNRETALQKAADALKATTIGGVLNNKYFLQSVLNHEDFGKNTIHTRWIESHPELIESKEALDEDLIFWGKKLSSELFVQRSEFFPLEPLRGESREPSVLKSFLPDKLHGSSSPQGLIRISGKFQTVEQQLVSVAGWISRFEMCVSFQHPVYAVGQRKLAFAGQFEVEDFKTHHGPIVAQVPGVVLNVRAHVDQIVEAQEPILVVEAMKIEMPMSLPVTARITAVHVKEGDRIKPGQTLVSWEPAA